MATAVLKQGAEPQPQRKTVAVIGAGIAGLVAAKNAAQAGLVPVVFDRRPTIGGMWGDASSTYSSLHTNVSRHACCFSDFPWPPSAPDFPSAAEMGAYLASYRDAFLQGYQFNLRSEILRVNPPPAGAGAPWRIDWRPLSDSTETKTETETHHSDFDFVIVATGFSTTPHIPDIPGLDTFPGLLIHSADYHNLASCAGRRSIAVIGGGHSSADIAADLAAAAVGTETTVVHVLPKPFWVTPRYWPLDLASPAPSFVPLDLYLFRRSMRAQEEEQLFQTLKYHQDCNALFTKICGDQATRLSPHLGIPPDSTVPVVVGISDTYGALVSSGRIQVRRGRLQRVNGPTMEFADGEPPLTGMDAVVLCTGLRPSLDFLPRDLLQTLSYIPYDNYIPLALHRNVLHPDVPGLAFVGMLRAPHMGVMELQARLAVGVLSGEITTEDEATQREGVQLMLRLREQQPRPMLPRPDYLGHAESLAKAVGVLPPAEWRAAHDIFVPAHNALFPPPLRSPLLAPEEEERRNAAAVAAARRAVEDVESAFAAYGRGRAVAGAVFRALAGEWVLHRSIVSRLDSSPSGTVTGKATFTVTPPPSSPPSSPAPDAGTAMCSSCPSAVRAASAASSLPYLYREQGDFKLARGPVMRVTREYEYAYDEEADRLDVFFRTDGARGPLFHSLRFLPPSTSGETAGPTHRTSAAADTTTVSTADVPEQGHEGGGGDKATSDGLPGTNDTASEGGWRAVGEHLCIRDMYNASYRFVFQGINLREFEIRFDVRGPEKDYMSIARYSRPG